MRVGVHAIDTRSCLDLRQANLMRFSAIFQHPVPQPIAGEEPLRAESPSDRAQPAAVPELPEDLDARVRLVGEWQLFDS